MGTWTFVGYAVQALIAEPRADRADVGSDRASQDSSIRASRAWPRSQSCIRGDSASGASSGRRCGPFADRTAIDLALGAVGGRV